MDFQHVTYHSRIGFVKPYSFTPIVICKYVSFQLFLLRIYNILSQLNRESRDLRQMFGVP